MCEIFTDFPLRKFRFPGFFGYSYYRFLRIFNSRSPRYPYFWDFNLRQSWSSDNSIFKPFLLLDGLFCIWTNFAESAWLLIFYMITFRQKFNLSKTMIFIKKRSQQFFFVTKLIMKGFRREYFIQRHLTDWTIQRILRISFKENLEGQKFLQHNKD